MNLRHLSLAAFLLANVPVLGWYIRRTTDGSDEPLGLLALAAALYLLWRERRELSLRPWVLSLGACLLVLAQFALLQRAPLLLGILSVCFVACGLSTSRGRSSTVLLLLLSLPLLASLDFYAGYPLRLVTAEVSARFLQVIGLDVTRSGVLLQHHGALIGVDPPCAGVRMLWTGIFVAALLAARQRASAGHTITLAAVAFLGVMLANVLRATILFFPESGRVSWPHWTHEAVGLVSHACLLAFLLASDGWLARKLSRSSRTATRERIAVPMPRHGSLRNRQLIGGFAALTALLAGIPIALGAFSPSRSSEQDFAAPSFTGWPDLFEGEPLYPLPLTAREEQFARSFPGAIARFQCGDSEIIMRHVTQPTRRLHSSADCLRAMGWQIVHKPVVRDAQGRTWGSFHALRPGVAYLVTERITRASSSSSVEAFTDVSAWYWNALWSPNSGPWLAVTVMRPIDALPH